MCSPASVIHTSIVTLLVSFEAVLVYFKAYCRKITLKLTSNVYIHRDSLQNCFKTYKYRVRREKVNMALHCYGYSHMGRSKIYLGTV